MSSWFVFTILIAKFLLRDKNNMKFVNYAVNPVWYKDEHRILTMSELAEMATTIVISTLPPSSPGSPHQSPATPPAEHVDVTPALFANPPLNYQLYSIYTSGSETKTSVLSISQVYNDTKVRK